jgi:hypothetical protein
METRRLSRRYLRQYAVVSGIGTVEWSHHIIVCVCVCVCVCWAERSAGQGACCERSHREGSASPASGVRGRQGLRHRECVQRKHDGNRVRKPVSTSQDRGRVVHMQWKFVLTGLVRCECRDTIEDIIEDRTCHYVFKVQYTL